MAKLSTKRKALVTKEALKENKRSCSLEHNESEDKRQNPNVEQQSFDNDTTTEKIDNVPEVTQDESFDNETVSGEESTTEDESRHDDETEDEEEKCSGGHEMQRIAGGTLMGFGRHCDLTFRQVYKENPGYYKWGKRLDSSSPKLQRFLDWVEDSGLDGSNGKTILTVGKHSGKTFSYIWKHDIGYVSWVRRSKTPCRELKEFQDWIMKQRKKIGRCVHVWIRAQVSPFMGMTEPPRTNVRA